MNKVRLRRIWAVTMIVCLMTALFYNPVLAAKRVQGQVLSEDEEMLPDEDDIISDTSSAVERGRTGGSHRNATPSEATPSTPSEATPSEAVDMIIDGVTPGNLWSAITNHPDFISWDLIRSLKVSGSLDGYYDFSAMNDASKSLERVDLSGTDSTFLPYLAFSRCYKLEEVILPVTLTHIGSHAFEDCYNLKDLDLSHVTSLEQYAFWNCTNLTLAEGTNFSPDLRHIPFLAFGGCKQLTGVDLSHITSLSTSAFQDCENLTLAEETGFSPYLVEIPQSAFERCENLTAVNLSNVKTFGYSAFRDCKNLVLAEGTNLSSEAVAIDNYAFYNCEQLGAVDLSGVIFLDEGAFYGCKKLTLADGTNLSADLTEIPWSAFGNCESLKGIDLSNVTYIGPGAFINCTELTEVDLSNVTFLSSSVFSKCKNLVLKDGSNLSAELKKIHEYTFYGCERLSGIDLSNIESISSKAFYGCESLNAIDLSSLTWIDDEAFGACDNIKAIALPELIPEIHQSVFTAPLLLLVKDGATYESLDEFPAGSAYPFMSGSTVVSVGSTLDLSISPDGGEGVSYQWYFNQTPLTGENGRTLTVNNTQKSHAGIYECDIRIGTVTQRISKNVTVTSTRNSGGGGSSTRTVSYGSWKQDAVGWWYRYNDGTYPKSEWKQINSEWYYFAESGYMQTNWLQQNGKWYWLDPGTGKMVKSNWVFNQDNWYYFGDDGAMMTGWIEYNNGFYYLSEVSDSKYGHMLSNTTTPDGYSVNQDGVRIP